MNLLIICLLLVNDVVLLVFTFLVWRHDENLGIHNEKLDFYINENNKTMSSLATNSVVIIEQLRNINASAGRYG